MERSRILVVEDEPSLSEPLAFLLRREGYDVEVVADGVSALAAFRSAPHDCVLLDLMLPGLGGLDVCREIRKESMAPVIMLTARDDEVDKVLGLELGADDYVTKPYSSRELVARIRSALRRAAHHEGRETRGEAGAGQLAAGTVRLDLERHRAWSSETELRLPLKEYELLETLVRNAGRVVTRGQLLDRVWGPGYVGDTKTLDVHIKRLRAKIETDPAQPVQIVTVRGVGYRFEEEADGEGPRRI